MVSFYIASSRLSTRGYFDVAPHRNECPVEKKRLFFFFYDNVFFFSFYMIFSSAQCIKERILQKSGIQDGGYSKLLVLFLSIMTSSVYVKNLSWKISLKTFITTLGFNDIYVLFMCKTLHKSLLLPINIGYITVESLSHQGRSPIWGSSFSASSLANICQNEGRQYL